VTHSSSQHTAYPSARIARFLDRTDVRTPFVVVDVDVDLDLDLVEERYHQLVEAIPPAIVYYAVKANPALPLLDRLNTLKKRRDVAYAASCGVTRFTVDAMEELEKVDAISPNGSVCVRLRHGFGGADWPLSRKFGCEAADVERLLIAATETAWPAACPSTSARSSATSARGTTRSRSSRR